MTSSGRWGATLRQVEFVGEGGGRFGQCETLCTPLCTVLQALCTALHNQGCGNSTRPKRGNGLATSARHLR